MAPAQFSTHRPAGTAFRAGLRARWFSSLTVLARKAGRGLQAGGGLFFPCVLAGVHGKNFCPVEPLNTTQLICEAL